MADHEPTTTDPVQRFRYVGLTTAVAQVVDNGTGSVIRHVATDWTGGQLFDFTGSGSNVRYLGTTAHHDVGWTTDDTGAVSATLRYDPWGTLVASSGTSLPDFRFQGSWFDTTTSLSWVIARWYAPAFGRFVSEDSLLGQPADPDSRRLYAYGEGDPILMLDPDGSCVQHSYAYWKLYGNACSASRTVTFAPRRGAGYLTIATFIKRDRECFLFVCGRGDGNDRDWSSPWAPDCLHSRACVRVDFDAGRASMTIRPSCGVAYHDCRDVKPILSNNIFGNELHVNDHYQFMRYLGRGYYTPVPHTPGCEDTWAMVRYAAKEGYFDVPLPPINGSVAARRCARGVTELYVKGDGYPWFEMYYTNSRGVITILRVTPAGTLQYLADGPGDWDLRLWR